MNVRKTLLASLFAAAAIGAPALFQARTYLDIDVAPPPGRVEAVDHLLGAGNIQLRK